MQMGPGSERGFVLDQILAGLAPIVDDAVRIAEAGVMLPNTLREATLAAFLVGQGMSPARAMERVTQWRTSGISRALLRAPAAGSVGGTPSRPLAGPGAVPGAAGTAVPLQRGTTGMQPGAAMPTQGRADLVSQVEGFIRDQVTAAAFYADLMTRAEDAAVKEYIDHAREDEAKHARMLQELYRELTGRTYSAEPEKVEYATLAEGLKRAMDDEYEAFEEYRDVYLKNDSRRIRDLFFELMTDELEHATRFNYALQVIMHAHHGE